MNEAKIEHLVGFIEDKHFDLVERESLLIDQVEQSTGRRHENIGAAMQLVPVLVDRRTADDALHLEAGKCAVILGALGNLPSQFARRREHQHTTGFERCLPVRIAQAVDAGQHEGGRLSGPRLRDAHEVAPFEDGRDRLCLNWSRFVVTLQVEGLENGLRQPEI